jgi:hypothetical protein
LVIPDMACYFPDATAMFLFRPKPPRLTRPQQLASKPVRLVAGGMTDTEGGGGRLKVPIQPRRWTGWLLRLPAGAAKTFEFDVIGRLVWDQCDGKTSVGQIARKLARTYSLSDREAQVATEKFLVMLANKGLIGAAVRQGDGAKTDSG